MNKQLYSAVFLTKINKHARKTTIGREKKNRYTQYRRHTRITETGGLAGKPLSKIYLGRYTIIPRCSGLGTYPSSITII